MHAPNRFPARGASFGVLSILAGVLLWTAGSSCVAADGELDSAFDGDGFRNVVFNLGNGNADTPQTIVVDDDNHLVVGGFATSTDYVFEPVFARLTPDGATEWKHHSPAAPNYPGAGFALTSRSMEGPCLSGFRYDPVNARRDGYIACVDPVGQIEIGTIHLTTAPAGQSIEWLAATPASSMQRFYTAGTIASSNASDADFFVGRFNTSVGGIALDTTFNAQQSGGLKRIDVAGQGVSNVVTAMASAVGGVYVAGYSHRQFNDVQTDYDFAIAAVGDDGEAESFDIAFDRNASSKDDRAYAVALDAEGRILLAGTVTKDAAVLHRGHALLPQSAR